MLSIISYRSTFESFKNTITVNDQLDGGNQVSLVDRSRVEGFVDVDCVGEDGVVEAHVHKIIHSVAGAIASGGAVGAISELATGTLKRTCI